MRRPVDAPALSEASGVLASLRETLAAVEDDLLSSLVVLGEPEPQRVLDGWVDQVVDLLRAVDEVAAQHRATISRAESRRAGRPSEHPDRAAPDASADGAVDAPVRVDRP